MSDDQVPPPDDRPIDDRASGGPTDQPTDPASSAAPPSRRSAIIRSGLIVGVLLLVFLVILPRFVDYSDVIEAFAALTFDQLIIMTALGLVAWAFNGLVFAALIQGLSALRGTQLWVILAGIGASVPFGPWNMAVIWIVARGWGVPNRPATAGIALYGVIDQLSKLALPLLAIAGLVATDQLGGIPNASGARLVAIIGIVAFFVVSGAIVAIVRSDRIAEWCGRTGQRVVGGLLHLLRRTGSPDVAGAIHRFRDQLGEVIRRRGLLSLAASIGSKLVWAVVFVAAQRVVGIDDGILTVGEIFAVYALVMVITIVPLSPGGAGVPELLYIAGLTAIAGDQYNADITAGVFLFRMYQWFLPIPFAWLLLKVTRRGKPMLPTPSEIKAAAAGEAI
jgi:uncharacterized membrane protein YbhN (UPF0104 family)